MQLRARDTLGVGWGGRRERRIIGVKKKIEQKTQRLGRWALRSRGEGVETKKKKGLLTHKVYIFTHTCTHLDIVHVKIYAIHTPASCQVPREPAAAALGGHG